MGSFEELVAQTGVRDAAVAELPRDECLAAARAYIEQQRENINHRHRFGASGADIVRSLSNVADEVLRGAFQFALAALPGRASLVSRVSLCALGGYGRRELSPGSDIDVCLLYEGELDENIRQLNQYLVPFLWDAGFKVGYGIRGIAEAIELAHEDIKAFTSFLEARLLAGDSTVFARMRLSMREQQAGDLGAEFVQHKVRDRYDGLPEDHRDLYTLEPNIKENAGGLRDFHTALWLLMMAYGTNTLDEALAQGLITPEEQLDFAGGLDFLWRIRNELHFRAEKQDDTLTYASQQRVAKAFGYCDGPQQDVALLMQDYYAAASMMRRFLRIAARICDYEGTSDAEAPELTENDRPLPWVIRGAELFAGLGDPDYFKHNPPRLMELFWRCARDKVHLSRSTERSVTENLSLVNETFRSSEPVRRYLIALCNHPLEAGHALRQAAHVGFLGRYLPEYAAVTGMIRYQNFHTYPVDEHTLRALESFTGIPEMDGPVGSVLREALENLSDPYILVLSLLFHDFGKVAGEVHVEESMRLTEGICDRIGLPREDREQIAFLVKHHILMNHISQYRDIDDEDIVTSFCDTVKSEQRLRALLLLSYADLYAVGPSVWNDWKGTLLMQLYLRAMKRLSGRAETVGEEYWNTPKAEKALATVETRLQPEVRPHLEGLGQRYFVAFTPAQVAQHIECVAEARECGLAMKATRVENAGMSEVVICTQDRQGLFAAIAGCFSSQLMDVHSAALFTRPDGWVVDVFTVMDAWQRQPLTHRQAGALERMLRGVLLEGQDVGEHVENSRRRLFALLQPPLPVQTRVEFDNGSSRIHTVIDLETGDRTGLLYDITRAMAKLGLDISTARIVTDARRVRDSFYVTQDRAKIEDEIRHVEIREALIRAIHPRTTAETKGDST
ncbi:MAG: [protein-PII] uridylyltransferase [bacterium]|nr:[protein-PII] uridylyltransferase [bacterium]